MESEPRFVVTPRLVLGLSIIFLGVALALDRLNIADAGRLLRFWPVGLMLIGGLMIVQNDGHQRTKGLVLFGVGTWIFLNIQGVLPISLWQLFWPIMLIVIGISLAMRPSHHRRLRRQRKRWEDPFGQTSPFGPAPADDTFGTEAGRGSPFVNDAPTPPTARAGRDGATFGGEGAGGTSSYAFGVDNNPIVSIFSIMSGVRRASNASPFRSGDITALMGGARLDLRLATIPPGGEAILDITTIMGGVEVVVPTTWAVSTPIVPFMGSVEDKRLPPLPVDGKIPMPDAQTPRLVIRGFVMMGSVELKS